MLRILTDKNVDDIRNIMRKPGCKSTDRMPDSGQQVSVIAQENLKLAIFFFLYSWRYTFDLEVTGVCDDTVHLLADQKRLKDD